eukprot:5366730-Pleurochrysis_carterae.AAC.1
MEPDGAEWTSIRVERSSTKVDWTRGSRVEIDRSGEEPDRRGLDTIGLKWDSMERIGPRREWKRSSIG